MRISARSFSAEPARHLRLALFAALAVVPPLLGLGYALAYSLGLVGALANGFTGEHWAKLLRTSDVTRALGFSFAVAAIPVALATTLALGLSLALRRAARSAAALARPHSSFRSSCRASSLR